MFLNYYSPSSPNCSCYVDRGKDLPVHGGQTTVLCWKRMRPESRNGVRIFRIRASFRQPTPRLAFSCVQKKMSALGCRNEDQMLAVFKFFGFRKPKLHFFNPVHEFPYCSCTEQNSCTELQ